MRFDELDYLVVLEQTIEGIAGVYLKEVLLLTVANQQTVVRQSGNLYQRVLREIEVVVAGQ